MENMSGSDPAPQDIQELELQVRKVDATLKQYEQRIEDYDKSIASKVNELKKWKEENKIAKQHSENLEAAYSDALQKYERCKTIIECYKKNGDALKQQMAEYKEELQKAEERYVTLKSHVINQFDKCNKEYLKLKEVSECEIAKIGTIIKRNDIKIESLNTALEHKKKECSSLQELVDEMTGQVG